MWIVGGTYLERTVEPPSDLVFGSGLRAGAALAGTGPHQVVTCIDQELRQAAQAVAESFALRLTVVLRNRPIGFSYYTPLTTPGIDGLNQPVCSVDVGDGTGTALVYGMLEADPVVRAEGIVFDPQRPRGPRPINRSRLSAQRFAVVANASEICSLAATANVHDAAAKVAAEARADVVVVKRGAIGALVHQKGKSTPIGPYQTERVWPIGFGDVFTAVFAWAWLEDGRPAVDAAALASAGTAAWCGDRLLPVGLRPGIRPEEIGIGVLLSPRDEPVKVYLAGPFFNIGSRWLVGLVYEAVSHLGGQVFSPYHHVGVGGDEVAQLDVKGLVESESILGLLDGADAGTLFEMGYATDRGMPAVGFAENPAADDYKMLRGLGIRLTNDISTAVYHAIWAGMRR